MGVALQRWRGKREREKSKNETKKNERVLVGWIEPVG